jgi:murein tripeptide amidase MpaA
MPADPIRHDRYYDYAGLTAALQTLERTFPDLATLRSIGTSFEGRELWLLQVTNSRTGEAHQKPGFYLDGHIHAEEHITSSAVLLAASHLLSRYAEDPEVTRLLDEQVFYLIPRLNPDGAERSLRPPYLRWVGNGRHSVAEAYAGGVIPEDLDGDGYITWMRVPDPRGEWVADPHDDRLLLRRQPGEQPERAYRLLPEGRVADYDGAFVNLVRPRDGNLNRNFHVGWQPEHIQYGAGAAPLSEPETRALVAFIEAHPNIAGMCTYHSHGGVMLRPSMTKPDSAMAPRDLALYLDIGAIGSDLTGYPLISVFEDFTPDKSNPRRGGFEDYVYETLGIPCFGPELWDIERAAGVAKEVHYGLHARNDASLRAILAWVDEHLGGHGFRPWTPFEHPELGPVEVGGLVDIWTFRNPPAALIEEVCRPHVRFNLHHAAAAPHVRLDNMQVRALAAGVYRVRAQVSNSGYLPTNLTDVALENDLADPVHVALHLDGDARTTTPAALTIGHLAGRNERRMPWSPFGPTFSRDSLFVEWTVERTSNAPITLEIEAWSARAGRASERLVIAAESEGTPTGG